MAGLFTIPSSFGNIGKSRLRVKGKAFTIWKDNTTGFPVHLNHIKRRDTSSEQCLSGSPRLSPQDGGYNHA